MKLWPTDDPFDEGATTYGTYLTGYLGAEMDASSYGLGFLHNGYGGGACVRALAADQDQGLPFGFMRREFFTKNVRVRAYLNILNVVGGGNINQVDTWGCLARVHNGSLTRDGTPFVAIRNADGYAMLAERDGQDSMDFSIVRYDAGTPTVLASTGSIIFKPKGFKFPIGLELRVVDDGGGGADIAIRLKGPTAIHYLPGDLPADGQNEFAAIVASGKAGPYQYGSLFFRFADFITILAVNDPSGSAHDEDGRCGFVTGAELITGGGSKRHVYPCSGFEVHDLDANADLWLDDWTRSSNAGRQTTDLHGTSGRSVQCDWLGDVQSKWFFDEETANGDNRSSFVRDAGNDRVYIDNASSGADSLIWGVSMREADSAKHQHRRITFNYSDPVADDKETLVGIMLRASHLDGDGNHYRLEARMRATVTAFLHTIHLTRRIGGVDTELAYDSISLPAENTDHTLGFEVLPLPGTTQENVQLIATYNGVQLPSWSNDLQVSGVEIFPGGEVVDRSGERILSGSQEGIYVRLGASSNPRQLRVDTWTQLAFSDPVEPSEVEFDAYDDIAVDDEQAGATGTLIIPSGWRVELMTPARVEQDDVISGKTRRLAVSAVVREAWRVSYVGQSQSEVDDLEAFWSARDGSEIPFTWTPPSDYAAAGVYKFRRDSYFQTQVQPGTYYVELILDRMEPS